MTAPLPTTTPRRVRAATLLGGVLLGVLALLLLPARAAQAHAAIVRTNPVGGSVVQTAPSEIVVTFSERVHPVNSRIQVIDPNGKKIDAGTPRVQGNDLHIPVRTDGPRGTYLVSFRVISADSHPVGGSFIYSVGAPSPGGAPAAIDGGKTDRAVAVAVSIEQFVGFAGVISLVGPVLVLSALWPRRLDRRGPTQLAFWGLGAVIFGSVLGIYLQAPYGNGGGLLSPSGSDIADVLDSTYGKAHLVRIAVALVSIFLLRPVLAGRAGQWDRPLLGALGVIGVLTWPLSGHPGASDMAPLTVVADAVHLSAVAVWVGGLVMLAGYLLRKASARELSAILPVWSNWAILAVVVLVLAGMAQALIEIGSLGALFNTTYGRVLLVKIGILAIILVFANTARLIVARHVRQRIAAAKLLVTVGADSADPELDGAAADSSNRGDGDHVPPPPEEIDAGDVRRLRRSVVAEVALAIGVLVASSILVQSTPARTAAAESALTASAPTSVTLNSSLYSLQVDFGPIATGTEIHMYAYSPTGAPIKVEEWKVTASMPARGIEPTPVDNILAITDSHAVAQATLPVGGVWTFSFTLRTTDIDEATVTASVPIS